MMRTDQTITRSNVIRVGIILSVMAFPLVAYSHSSNIEPAMTSTPLPVLASLTSKIAPNNDEIEADGRDACREQTWPYFSKDCLRGKGRALQLRQIPITEEAAAASAASNDQVQIAAAPPSAHKAFHIKQHKRIRRNGVTGRRMQARETFAEAAPYEGRDSWRAGW